MFSLTTGLIILKSDVLQNKKLLNNLFFLGLVLKMRALTVKSVFLVASPV